MGNCTLNNCTLVNNAAASTGGGTHFSTLNNCIVYYNTTITSDAANYDPSSALNYSCTTPLPTSGIGNISLEPQLASASHLSANSPCLGRGSYSAVSGTDIDGEPWANPPAMGCDQYYSGAITGSLSVALSAPYSSVATGFNVDFRGFISGRAGASRWEFGDGTVLSNQLAASHAWSVAGDYPVILRAYNETYPTGVTAVLTVHVVAQPIHYVAWKSASPAAPYSSWSTAANTIQDAVDAATVPGAMVLVTNGIYAVRGQVDSSGTTNRVVVDKLLTVKSVNGAQFTMIDGSGIMRCAYLTNGSSMVGFTLTNGFAEYGGGVVCQSAAALVSNCVLAGNLAYGFGGGAYNGTLNNCTLIGNSAPFYNGGGALSATLNNCILIGNSAPYGGGVSGCIANNCVLTRNSAETGGAAFGGTLNNCTLTGNRATNSVGGASGELNNCIVYYNTAPTDANYDSVYSTLNYCCTTPLPTNGVGNISSEPQLASASHLAATSPCRGAGSSAYVSGMDIDGEPWSNPPSIGCDELRVGSVTGALAVALLASYTNAAIGFSVDFQALIAGRLSASRWEFGDGTVVSNRPYTSHSWSAAGDYPVILRAYNDSYPGGISSTVVVHVVTQPIHYVAAGNVNPVSPYTSWATAASNIQDAVDAATVPTALVLVTNGTYANGGKAVSGIMTNRVAVDKLLRVQSVNGPEFTVIKGYQVPATTNGDGAIRCVYLMNGAILSGFTLTGGATVLAGYGGGLWCEPFATATNCVVSGNSAFHGGGGAYGGKLNNCTLTGNVAVTGGGASDATLNNCTLIGNRAFFPNGGAGAGGGAHGCTLNNCMLASNSATVEGGGADTCTLNSCTLTNNSASQNGGGASGSTLNNCSLSGNSAPFGGGAYRGTLNNCTLRGNLVPNGYGAGMYGGTASNCLLYGNTAYQGGGSYLGTLNNCTLTGNSASSQGGGAVNGTLNNCIVYFNTASAGANFWQESYVVTLNYCCTTPVPTNGMGNFTNAPRFVDQAGGNLRLQTNSPCINAGLNAYSPVGPDLDGNPRIAGVAVDVGAYEFQSPASVLSYAWLQRYGLPTDGSADYLDSDGDRANNWQEWIAGTIPTDVLSALRMFSPSNNVSGLAVSWQSVSNRNYFLERANGLDAASSFSLLTSNIVGQAGTTVYTDTNANGPGPFFYRVGVQQ